MITYELARQLKDAGFPTEIILETDGENIWEVVRSPTLSELIEACGEFGFESLISSFDGEWKKYFIAKSAPKTGSKQGTGKTPEEAVTNLYLELKKK